MFISNKRLLFHLWGKENIVKPQNVSGNYETDCSQNTFFIKRGRIPVLSLNKLGEMSRMTIVLGDFH